jgi:serine/threonine protein kinase
MEDAKDAGAERSIGIEWKLGVTTESSNCKNDKSNSDDDNIFHFVIPKTLPIRPVEVIGIGSFSTVCRAEAEFGNGKTSFAIKKLENALSKDTNPGIADISRVAREIIILKTISHPFLLKAKGIWLSNLDVYIATQHVDMELGALFERHRRMQTNFQIEEIELFSYQLLSGLSYLHGIGIVHCDLCPRNILIDNYGHLCIADFGLARPSFTGFLWNKIKFSPIGITLYTAPEIILNVAKKCNYASDMWSAGCILFEFFNNNKSVVHTRNSMNGIFNSIGAVLGRPNGEIIRRLYNDHENTLNSIVCDGVPKIKTAVQQYFEKNVQINNNGNDTTAVSNNSTIVETFDSMLKELITFEYDKRMSAKDILIKNKDSSIFSSLINEWGVGKEVYETFTTNNENLTNVKNILKENMKLELEVYEKAFHGGDRSKDENSNHVLAYDMIENAIRKGVEDLKVV